MKKTAIALMALIGFAVVAVLFAGTAFATMTEDGLAVPTEGNLVKNIESGGDPIEMTQLRYDDVIYRSAAGYYVGSQRNAVDLTYPMYVNGGAGIRFWDEDNWLITTEVDIYRSFDGQYISEGISYNRDMTQADDGEFILVSLPNGLYMNAQNAVFSGPLGEKPIPANSVLRLAEESLRWYSLKDGALQYEQEEAVFGASISIGNNTYRYTDLLDALGIIRRAIDESEAGRIDPDLEEEALTILNPNRNNSSRDPSTNQDPSGQNTPGAGRPGQPGGIPGQSGSAAGTGAVAGGSGAGAGGTGAAGSGTDGSNSNNSSEDSNEGSSGSGNSGSSSDNGEDQAGGAGGAGGSSSGAEDSDDTTGGGNSGSGGGNSGNNNDNDDNKGENTNGNQSTGGSGSQGDGSSQDPGVDDPDSEAIGGVVTPRFQEPVISIKDVEPWSYAIGMNLDISDIYGTLHRGVSLSVYRELEKESGAKGEPTEVELEGSGKLMSYPSDSYSGRGKLLGKTRNTSGDFALSTLSPGSKVYLQYTYRFYEPEYIEVKDGTGDHNWDEKTQQYYRVDRGDYAQVFDKDGKPVKDEYGQLVYKEKEDGGFIQVLDKYGKPVLDKYGNPTYKAATKAYYKLNTYRVRRYSPLYEIQLPMATVDNVQPMAAQWNTKFAASANGFALTDLKMKNLSAYEGEKDPFDFEHFKLNSLPYVDHLLFTLVDDKGAKTEIRIPSATLKQAQQNPDGVPFQSRTPELKANSRYTYTVAAMDRSGQAMPLQTSHDGAAAQNVLFTQKAAPKVKVEIPNEFNITDSLVVRVEVEDPDHALAEGESLRLQIRESKTNGSYVSLFGQWDTDEVSEGGEGVKVLELKDAGDGAEYELKVESLAFSRMYVVEVKGDYNAQPDAADAETDGKLPDTEDALLGSASVYTASLEQGKIAFTSTYSNVLDTSVTLNITMNQETTHTILPLVDEFRLTIRNVQDPQWEPVVVSLPQETLLKGENYTYDDKTATVLLQQASGLKQPAVSLYGAANQYIPDGEPNPWDSLIIHCDEGNVEEPYSKPMELRVAMPDNSLEPFNRYSYTLEAVVKKSGEEFYIPVTQSGREFVTKKTIPTILYEDLFLAADRADFLELLIYDPDGTILNDGAVNVYLYYNTEDGTSTLLNIANYQAYQQYADDPSTLPGEDLEFKGLVSGGRYTLKFVAPSYNDAEGYGSYATNKLLASYDIVAGSELNGAVTLNRLIPVTVKDSEDNIVSQTYDADLKIQVNDNRGYLTRPGQKAEVTLTVERSGSMELPEYEAYGDPITLELVKEEDGTCYLEIPSSMALEKPFLKDLSLEDGWQLTLTTKYQDDPITLAQTTFRTDSSTILVKDHKGLIEAQGKPNPFTGKKDCNIVVTSDFVQDQNTYVSDFYGNIDFQGHVVTKGSNITTSFLDVNEGCRVENLVYDYPKQSSYDNKGSIFPSEQMHGTVENLMVRTYGTINMHAGMTPLITQTLPAKGTLRNFIVKLGGDIDLEGDDYKGALISNTISGTIENGYVYGVNGAGIICREMTNGGGLFGYCGNGSSLRNIFVVMDSWYETNANGALFNYQNDVGTKQNIYTVGEFYEISRWEAKHRQRYCTEQHVVHPTHTPGPRENIWMISNVPYTMGSNVKRFMTSGSVDLLYDASWQRSVLGSAFDIDQPVSMGFYPRLKLSECMARHQEYLYLPQTSASMLPQIVSDEWAAGYEQDHKLDSGYISLRLKNDSNATITGLQIPGLKVSVQTAMQRSDGVYCTIVAHVAVDHRAAAASSSNIGYVSSHAVTSISYKFGDMAESTTSSNYVLKNIDMWKSVANIDDWHDINKHMGWNYKLTSDITFIPENAAGQMKMMTIDGSEGGWSGTTTFTGRLDGQEHVVRGIRLNNVPYASIIYYASYATIRNIFFEDVELSFNGSGTAERRAGIIGYSACSTIENVRVNDSTIKGGHYVGGIVGYATYSPILACSVTNSVLEDVEYGKGLYLGGISGYNTYGSVTHCYVQNTAITVDKTTVVSGVGGIAGRGQTVRNCYAQGSMTVTGDYVGGISGYGGTIDKCWSYVDIVQSGGNYVAGIIGTRDSTMTRNLALGNISSTASELDRTGVEKGYYYADQVVSGMLKTDRGPKNSQPLVDLAQAEAWQDIVQLGEAYDYSPLKSAFAPKLRRDAARGDWQQANLSLPGMGNTPTLEILHQDYTEAQGQKEYRVQVLLTHPSLALTNVVDTAGHTLEYAIRYGLTLDGMDISEGNEGSSVTIAPYTDKAGVTHTDKSTITIVTDDFVNAYDMYTLTVAYNVFAQSYKLTAAVEYQNTVTKKPHHNYWEIPDITVWNARMPDHGVARPGKKGENFRITGEVDFGGSGTENFDLDLNRLEGNGLTDANGSYVSTLKNLAYNGGEAGTPWIRKVAMPIKDLRFEDMTFDYSYVIDNQKRAMTGAVITSGGMQNLQFQDLVIRGGKNSSDYLAFVSQVSGDVSNVTMDTTRVEAAGSANYCATLVGYSLNDFYDITAEDTTVYAPSVSYVGGVVGRDNLVTKTRIYDVSMTGVYITGKSYVGGIAGSFEGRGIANCTVTSDDSGSPSHITGSGGAVGGILGSSGLYQDTDPVPENNHVSNLTITTTTGTAGGMAGGSGWFIANKSSVVNCTIKGTSFVGGVHAAGPAYLRDVLVKDCIIENTAESGSEDSMGVGGLQGAFNGCEGQSPMAYGCVVRNCKISGPVNVGGAIGSIVRVKTSDTYERNYIGRDVTVTATQANAGGLIGYGNTMQWQYCAVGATVTAPVNAGGVIGKVIGSNSGLVTRLEQIYFGGTVTAQSEYAGGIVGYLSDSSLEFTDDTLKNCAVTGKVYAPDEASAWANVESSSRSGTGLVYIWDGVILNGETIGDMEQVQLTNKDKTHLAPPKDLANIDLILTADQMSTKSFYKDTLKFSTDKWSIDTFVDAEYMPAPVRHYSASQKLDPTSEADKKVLVPLPKAEAVDESYAVYTSGLNSINIEFPQNTAITSFILNGAEAATAVPESRVVSIPYAASVTIKVGDEETTFSESQYSRKVMTYGSNWFFIGSDGKLYWGTDTAMKVDADKKPAAIPLPEGQTAVHLWGGKVCAMDAEGNIKFHKINITGDTASLAAGEEPAPSKGVPFWSSSGANGYNMDTYFYYSELYPSGSTDITPLDFRVYWDGNQTRTVTRAQQAVYDGVFAKYDAKQAKASFALLYESGELVAHVGEMKLDDLTKLGIQHMSNTQGYTGKVLVTWYGPGQIQAINVETGILLHDTVTTTTKLAAVFQETVNGLAAELMGTGNYEGYGESQKLQTQMYASGKLAPPAAYRDVATDVGIRKDGEETADTMSFPPETLPYEQADGPEMDGGSESDNVSADPFADSEAEDLADGAGGAGESAAKDQADSAGEPSGSGSGGVRSPHEDGLEVIGGTGSGGTGSTSGWNTTGGEAAVGGSSSLSGTGDTSGMTAVSGDSRAAAIQAVFGDSLILYSEDTGSYELMDGASVAAGEPRTVEEVLAEKKEKEAAAAKATEPEMPQEDGNFRIHLTANRNLFSSEQKGFVFIAIASGVALLALLLIFLNIHNKRKR